jgi:hypothetical protein
MASMFETWPTCVYRHAWSRYEWKFAIAGSGNMIMKEGFNAQGITVVQLTVNYTLLKFELVRLQVVDIQTI